MDIVYLWNHYKDGTELRYSLRALEKNGQNVSRVWLLGRKPDWASDEITEIGYDSNKNLHKENDITAAIFRAAEVPELRTSPDHESPVGQQVRGRRRLAGRCCGI